MTFRVATEAGAIIEVEGTSAAIGRDRFCAIAFPDDERLCGQHATIKRVAGRWMVESQGDHLLTAGKAPPARVHWLQPGDTIGLTENGPKLVFEPAVSATPSVAPPVPAVANRNAANDKVEAAIAADSRDDAEAPSDTAEDREYSSQHLVAWGVGGLAAVLIVMFALMSGIFKRDAQSVANSESPPEAPSTAIGVTDQQLAPETPVETITATPPLEEAPDPNRALYAIVVKYPGGQMYQLGTAFAVSPHRVVTVASAIKSAKQLISREPGSLAVLISPETKREISLDFSKTKVHPEFERASAELDQLIPQGEALDKRLKQPADEAEYNQIVEQLVQLQEKAYQASDKIFLYDIGVIEVAQDLGVQLKPIETSDRPRVSSKIVLRGIPVEGAELMWDPAEPPVPDKSGGNILMLLPDTSSKSVKRLVLTCDRDLSGSEWLGSPVLNNDGKVIGVYARRTPSPPSMENKQIKVTHDAINIGQLNDL